MKLNKTSPNMDDITLTMQQACCEITVSAVDRRNELLSKVFILVRRISDTVLIEVCIC